MQDIQLSIIVPVYNVENYLSECLSSLINTSFENYEIIVINDGSTDNSYEIITNFKNEYSELIKIINQSNKGLSCARNTGLRNSKGAYIAFVDSDDKIEFPALVNMLNEIKFKNADICVGDYCEYNLNGKFKIRKDKSLIERDLSSRDENLNKLFNIEVSFAVWNKLYKREFLEKNSLYFKEGVWFEDLDFVFKSFYYANLVVKSDVLYYYYRQRNDSIMKSINPKLLDKVYNALDLKDFLEKNNDYIKHKTQFKGLYFRLTLSIIYHSLRYFNFKYSFSIIIKAINIPFMKNEVLMPPFPIFLNKKEVIIFYIFKFLLLKLR